jgi:hypothetical protein
LLKGSGDWTQYRKLPGLVEVDFHYEGRREIDYNEAMDGAWTRGLDALRSAGDPVPDGMLKLYRGVAGRGRARHVRGSSWTGTLDMARWFAGRAAAGGAADPAVYQIDVASKDVLVHLGKETGRSEDEYLVDVPELMLKPRRIESVNEATFERTCAERRREWGRSP